MDQSLHSAITDAYYQTTAGRGHTATREHYEGAIAGMKRRVQPWLPQDRNARCLDLACGCGEMLYLLEKEGFKNVAGVDLCRAELDQVRPFVMAELHHADVVDFLRKAEPASFDFITALNFLEHLPKDALYSVLTEARRVLRPGGTLVAMVPNAISPFSSMTRHWDMTHEWAFTPNNFRQLASICGYSPEVDFRECGPVGHGVKSYLRVLTWKAIRVAISAWLLVEVADRKGGVYTMDMMVRLHA